MEVIIQNNDNVYIPRVQLLLRLCWGYHHFGYNTTYMQYMDVSKNRGTPKSSILIGFSIINRPFWGTPIFGNTHIHVYTNINPFMVDLEPFAIHANFGHIIYSNRPVIIPTWVSTRICMHFPNRLSLKSYT